MDRKILEGMEVGTVYELYTAKFGRTLTWFQASTKPGLKGLLIKALLGERGVVRDEDLGFKTPSDPEANI